MIASKVQVFKKGELVSETDLSGIGSELSLGRGDRCEIRLDDRAVSRRHASLRLVQAGVQIDKKSDFGLLKLNGIEVDHAILKLTDIVQIGPYDLRIAPGQTKQESDLAHPERVAQPPALERVAPEFNVIEPMDHSDGVDEQSEPDSLDSQEDARSDSLQVAEPISEGPILGGGEEGGKSEASSADLEVGSVPNEQGESQNAIEISEFDPEGATRVLSNSGVKAFLVFNEGSANQSEYEISSDSISIGRGKECDIVIDDKKASRKNSILTRNGSKFSIKDLESANGTFINGEKVQEADVSGEDKIKIGNTEFRLKLLSSEFAEKQGEFLEVAKEPEPVDEGLADALSGGLEAEANDQAVELPPPEGGFEDAGLNLAAPDMQPVPRPGIQGILDRIKSLPPRSKLVLGLVVAAAAVAIAMPDEVMEFLDLKEPKPVVSSVPSRKNPRAFENLRAEIKALVEQEHALASENFGSRRYRETLLHLAKVHEHVDFYKDSKQLETYARTGVQAEERLESERRKKESEERRRTKVKELVSAARDHMRKKEYEAAKDKFSEILALDPENSEVIDMRKEIERIEEQHRRQEESNRVQMGINERAKRVLEEGLLAKDRKRFKDAIAHFKTVITIGAPDARYAEQASREIIQCESEIKRLRDPLIEEARLAEAAEEYTKAFKLLQEALEMDPDFKPAQVSLERVKQKFELVARAHYIEGVILEGLNDFEGAQKKFKQILDEYPKESIYHEKSSKRHAKYFILELLSPKPSPSAAPSPVPSAVPTGGLASAVSTGPENLSGPGAVPGASAPANPTEKEVVGSQNSKPEETEPKAPASGNPGPGSALQQGGKP